VRAVAAGRLDFGPEQSVTDAKGETRMSMLQEFKNFAIKGNVMDLAVGVIIGAAFGKIVDSVVNDLIMPIIGRATGGLDFSNYYVALKDIPAGTPLTLDAVKKSGVPVFAYGNFITIVIYFVILAFIIFMMVKWINKLKAETPPAAPAAEPEDVKLLREIRDALKK
jgi:large conductance mechanosensitive channel